MKINLSTKALFIFCLFLNTTSVSAADYYVSTSGSDLAQGTITEPFATIKHATSIAGAGDTIYIRAGIYQEVIDITGLIGSAQNPITITSYQGEQVRIDGTKSINDLKTGVWSLATTEFPGTSNIYKVNLSEHVWQLFVDDRLQIPARWPNANTHPTDPIKLKANGYEAANGNWWSRETTWANADMPGTSAYTNIENNPSYHDLAATGKSFKDGTVIYSFLSQGGDGNQERLISSHTAGSNLLTHPTYSGPGTKKGYTSSDKFFIVEHLQALDKAEEWYYLPESKTLYLWAANGQDPNSLNIHGRVTNRSIVGTGEYVSIKGIDFFAGTFDITGSNLTIEGCRFTFPDASRRMLGEYAIDSDAAMQNFGSLVNGANFSMINSVYEYAEMGIVLEKPNSINGQFVNNLFQYVGMWGTGKNSLVQFAPTFIRNTVKVTSARGLFKSTVNGDSSLRNQSYNRLSLWGFLQVHDGSGLQVSQDYTQQTIRSNNWFLNAAKYGSRWDGRPANHFGTNHHSVGVNVRGAFQVKGDNHSTFNNTAINGFDDKNDIIIVSDIEFGGNANSVTQNNLADRMAGERTGDTTLRPIPGIHSHNWNGYEETGKAENLLVDAAILDFRPKANSALVDAGTVIVGITDGYIGTAPDIGAYEYGDDEYWIPGFQSEKASTPIPFDGAIEQPIDRDLIFLPGYKAAETKIYFGTDANNLSLITTRANPDKNIVIAGQDFILIDNTTYYWRVDTILADGNVITGDVWTFNVAPILSDSLNFTPTDDTFVNAALPTTNYGTNTTIRHSGTSMYGYIAFDVQGLGDEEVTSAILKLKSFTSDIADTSVHEVDGSWDESTLTWSSDDLIWGKLLDRATSIKAQTIVNFDVTDALKGDGSYTFGLSTSSSAAALKYMSKEDLASPELILSVTKNSLPTVSITFEESSDGVLFTATKADINNDQLDIAWYVDDVMVQEGSDSFLLSFADYTTSETVNVYAMVTDVNRPTHTAVSETETINIPSEESEESDESEEQPSDTDSDSESENPDEKDSGNNSGGSTQLTVLMLLLLGLTRHLAVRAR